MGSTRGAEIAKKLEDIEKRIESGEDVRKDFWKLVGEIKRSRKVNDDLLKRVALLRDKIFRKKVVTGYRRGAAVFILFFIISNALLLTLALLKVPHLLKGVVLILTEFAVLYFTFLTGRILGAKISRIGVERFYMYNPLEFGMKLDYVSYLRVSQKNRVVFFLTPILLENLVLAAQAVTLILLKNEFYWIPLLILVSNIPFAYLVHKIKKTGELHRLIREIRILLSEKSSARYYQQSR